MAGMKVTLSAAMRARDVSRPRPEHEEAAERAEARRDSGGSAPRPSRDTGSRGTGSRDTGSRGTGSPDAGGRDAGGRRRKRR